ncbi:hypothetical protein BEL04_17730 [Mucilaginibacter sp. PPCGB 2223]|uniref:hypothetical protein n=1 Tax=Mucilaginibacter sp. PPCGB 2223 TaxID=1886027 RepID=UPI00082547FE|nr:hypothetical protein [Mucilaginibacter sp. PPCGB 2223]OCX51850.1 hypothetical protein BEL04_17730 [Mucilaginibacter sp. PPCGB 2223]
MKTYILYPCLILFLFAVSNCSPQGDPYYTDHGDWDDSRFPLIKPYEALCLNGSKDWFVQMIPDSVSVTSIPGVRKINIIHQMILIYGIKTVVNFQQAKEGWFVIIPAQHIRKDFTLHQEYLNYLNTINIKNEPKLYEAGKICEYFGKRDTIDWKRIDDD